MTAETAFAARGLSVRLGGRPVLRNMDLDIPRGRWTAMVGPNGAGKSTLLRVLAGLQSHAGEVRLLGQPLSNWKPRARARRVAWLGQNEVVTNDLTAYDVTLLGRLPHQGWLAPASDADHQAVVRALQATQAWDWRDRPLGALSGGERQRVLLARALAVEADVLLMDEPLTNLDPPHQADWLKLARGLVDQGRTVVSVLHEVPCALLADELVVLAAGAVFHQGSTHADSTHRAVEQVFEERLSIRSSGGQWVAVLR